MNSIVYKDLLKRAHGILKKYKIEAFEASDLISEVFLKFGFQDEDSFAKKMFTCAGILKENTYKKDEIKFHHERVCRKCKENKPSICFRRWYLRGYLIFDSYCSDCKNLIVSMSKKKRRRINKSENISVSPHEILQCGVGQNITPYVGALRSGDINALLPNNN